jgi:hypothetical protein
MATVATDASPANGRPLPWWVRFGDMVSGAQAEVPVLMRFVFLSTRHLPRSAVSRRLTS